ncbi:hypothetical protein Tco_1507885 [Tanacetum coccineum]
MDSIIPIGQKNTLADMILSGDDNHPLMLDKDLTKKYAELSATEKIQDDCDLKATNIILKGLPSDIYSLVNHHRVAKDLWEKVQLLMQCTSLTNLPPEWNKFVTDVKLVKDLHTTNFNQLHAYLEQHELHANEVHFGLAVPVFKQGDDPIDAINKIMSFLSIVVTSHFPSTNNQLSNSSNPRQQATIHDGKVTVQPLQERQNSYDADTSGTRANTSGTGENYSGGSLLQPPITKNQNALIDSQAVNKSPTHYPCDSARTFRVILFSIHNDEWKSFQCHHQTALRRPYALSWKPCQGDSLNLPDHRIHKDGDGDASFQLKSDS